MNKNYLLAGGVILVLAGVVGYVVMNKPQPAREGTAVNETRPSPSETPSQTPTPTVANDVKEMPEIDFDGKMFSPKSIAVKRGTAVKFVNKGSTTMWVASAPHPVHTDYPEFDEKQAGDEYTFVFKKVGSWKYHNHTPFVGGGVITVTP